jgi:hypothetical protein
MITKRKKCLCVLKAGVIVEECTRHREEDKKMDNTTTTQRTNALTDLLQRIERDREALEANGLSDLLATAQRYEDLKPTATHARVTLELSYSLEDYGLNGLSLSKAESELRDLAFEDILELVRTDLNSALEVTGRWF